MTAAARVLAIQQPTVSSHIQRLEVDFGVELFHRRGRRLELTSFGCTVLNYTGVPQWRGRCAHCSLLRKIDGQLVIHAIGQHNVLPVLKLFMKQFPQVNVAVGVGDSRTITEKILDYQGDVGMALNHVAHPDLIRAAYRTQRLVILATPNTHSRNGPLSNCVICRVRGSSSERKDRRPDACLNKN